MSVGVVIDGLVVLDRHRPRRFRAQLLRPPHLRLPDRRETPSATRSRSCWACWRRPRTSTRSVPPAGRPSSHTRGAAEGHCCCRRSRSRCTSAALCPRPVRACRGTAASPCAWRFELLPSLPSMGIVRGSNESSEPMALKSRMMSSLIRPPGLKTNPPTVNPSLGSGAGGCAAVGGARPSRSLASPQPPSTGALVCALAEPIAHRKTAGSQSPLITLPTRVLRLIYLLLCATCALSDRERRLDQRHAHVLGGPWSLQTSSSSAEPFAFVASAEKGVCVDATASRPVATADSSRAHRALSPPWRICVEHDDCHARG